MKRSPKPDDSVPVALSEPNIVKQNDETQIVGSLSHARLDKPSTSKEFQKIVEQISPSSDWKNKKSTQRKSRTQKREILTASPYKMLEEKAQKLKEKKEKDCKRKMNGTETEGCDSVPMKKAGNVEVHSKTKRILNFGKKVRRVRGKTSNGEKVISPSVSFA